MSGVIINHKNFNEWAGKIKDSNDTLNRDLLDIQKEINNTASYYDSDSGDTIREKITNMTSKFEEYYRIVNNYVVAIRNIAADWENQEKVNKTNADQFI